MKASSLFKYISPSPALESNGDEYWSQVILMMRMDSDANSLGLPVYRDYSKYQYHTRYREGTATGDGSMFRIVDNYNPGSLPGIASSSTVDVKSYLYLPNISNRNNRIGELNSQQVRGVHPSYIETKLNGNPDFSLGTSEFTLECSFFAEQLNLPWRAQTIFATGYCLYIEPPVATLDRGIASTGYGVFIYDDKLYFYANNTKYQFSATALQKDTWYHLAVVRAGNVLKLFINGILTSSHAFTSNLTISVFGDQSDNLFRSMTIGASHPYASFNSVYGLYDWQTETCLSGGLSNLRITKAARYTGSFYDIRLPFPVYPVQNKLDAKYSDVLMLMPCTYDYYDYSVNGAHIQNRQLLASIPKLSSHSIHLDGKEEYRTRAINKTLDPDKWCAEFYIVPYLSGSPLNLINEPTMASPSYSCNTLTEQSWKSLIFTDLESGQIYGTKLDETIPLLRITTSDNKNILDVEMRILSFVGGNNQDINQGVYFSAKVSANGTDWVTFPSETGINLVNNPSYPLPDEEIKFAGNFSHAYTEDIETDTSEVKGAYGHNRYHLAIQKSGQSIHFFINGVLNKSLSMALPLYSGTNLAFVLGGAYDSIKGRRTFHDFNSNGQPISEYRPYSLTLGLSGIRVTNNTRYSISASNDIQYSNSAQPLPLDISSRAQSRARVIDIIRKNNSPLVSTQELRWYVLLNQAVLGLDVSDFTLTPSEGLTGPSITSISKINALQYELVVDAGQGNGKVVPNFIDNTSVKYLDGASISYYPGELNVTGEEYIVSKTKPSPVIYSGSNPYINSKFLVYIKFDAPISDFNVENIGIENASVTKYKLIDENQYLYELEITPIGQGVIRIKALEGTGVTSSALTSNASNTLVRVYQPYFPILQVPFNSATRLTDLSPSQLPIQEVIPNSSSIVTDIAPFGESGSLYVNSLLEQSGLSVPEYNVVGDLTSINDADWTIEFFLRINSTIQGTSRRAHILSIENSQGLAIIANQGKLLIGRSPTQSSNLFPSVDFRDRDSVAFLEWDDSGASTKTKYPHFAISKKGDVYRFYRNGVRIGIVQSSVTFNITKGKLNLGYYPVTTNDIDYYLSNVRITYGKALYTAYSVNVPYPPYQIVPNINASSSILNYASLYSDNNNPSIARTGNNVILKFSTSIVLQQPPTALIAGKSVAVSKDKLVTNGYIAELLVTSEDVDGTVPFSITIPSQNGISASTITKTTNQSYVVIDNTPLEISISSTSPNNSSHTFDIDVLFSESVESLQLSDFQLLDCSISNLYKYPDSNKYRLSVVGRTSGTIAINIPANRVRDLAGNYNLASNTFIRDVIVPAYVPDPYWNNVCLLLQPTSSIVDSSVNNSTLTATNVVLTHDTSPPGIAQSMYFAGNASINITSQSLPSSMEFTIELFVYVSSLTSLRLTPPVMNPASNIGTDRFKLSWNKEVGLDYVIDVARNSSFSNKLPGFTEIPVGQEDSYTLVSNYQGSVPKLDKQHIVGDKGLCITWEGRELDYKPQLSLTPNFSQVLDRYSDALVSGAYLIEGNLANSVQARYIDPVSTPVNVANEVSHSGSIVTGILKDGTGYPQLDYFLEESSIRAYRDNKYSVPAIIEDVELRKWQHVALVNRDRYTYLYIDGEMVDRVKNMEFTGSVVVGHNIGFFNGYMTGIRITKGVARYRDMTYTVPTLPYPIN